MFLILFLCIFNFFQIDKLIFFLKLDDDMACWGGFLFYFISHISI